MGEMIEIKCQKCGKTTELRLGQGLAHGRQENVTALFPVEIRNRLPIRKMKTFDTPWDFRYVPAVCKSCRTYVAIPSIQLNETAETFTAGCPECSGEVTPVDLKTIGDQPCPSCGEKACSVRETGMWD